MKNNNAQNFDSLAYISMSLKTMFAFVLEQGSCPGYIVISDSQDYKFGHIRKINFTAMRKLLNFVAVSIGSELGFEAKGIESQPTEFFQGFDN